MENLNKNHVGLTLGIFVALWHLLWAVLVLAGVAKTALDWILPMHFFSLTFDILEFNILNALILTIAAFIGGYVMGWVFALVWDFLGKKFK